MKKETSVILSYGLEDFLGQMDKYSDSGWTIVTDSYRVCVTASSNLYSVLVQRNVVEQQIETPVSRVHGYACACQGCRDAQ